MTGPAGGVGGSPEATSGTPPRTPSGRWSYAVTVTSTAAVETVWPLLGQAHRWPEWSFLDRADLVRLGDPPPDGVGAIRRMTRVGIGSREEVVVWEPPHHLGYVILSGFPVRHYRSDVVLTPGGPGDSGTVIDWRGTFDPRYPGTGRLLQTILTRMITGFATAAARYAEGH